MSTDVSVAVSTWLFGPEAGFAGLRSAVQHLASQEAEETPTSAEMSGNEDRNGKLQGVTLTASGRPLAHAWGPVAADHSRRCLSLPLH